MNYHLSGTAEQFIRDAPSKLAIDAARIWAVENAVETLHLGGGVGGSDDSLFRFKSGFSRSWAAFRSVRIITMPEQYRRIAQSQLGKPSDEYFPAYRRPG